MPRVSSSSTIAPPRPVLSNPEQDSSLFDDASFLDKKRALLHVLPREY
jgi:hypothetical protein